ncbi:M64 family metallopeptidase [Sphingobacterium sp. xlx-130]|uniref:Ig-like domain-containing protein n=1 Tax=Sphingobacterium sp. xlx-130 TaxID=2654323 RepID=UPI0013DC1176|nr:M64 family metallopeptidase [Sphingobacterium sp. xlx-130]
MVLILVNSPFYGGSGGTYATSTVNMASNEIAIHEIGHFFAKLGDKYWAGNQYAYESPNSSQISDANNVAWSHWLGINGVKVYSYGNKDSKSNWYRPHESCKMQTLKAPFCSVCQEQFVRKIHELTSPILRREPAYDTVNQSWKVQQYKVELALPFPNTLKVQWLLNAGFINSKIPSVCIDPGHLGAGKNVLEIIVEDTTSLVRNPTYNSNAVYVESWNIVADTVLQIVAPKVTCTDSLQTCYGTSQVINIEYVSANGVYRWYDKEEGGEPLSEGPTFHTPRIFENSRYYVDMELDGKVSQRTSVNILCFSALQVPPGVKIKWNNKSQKYIVSLVNDVLDSTERYKWTESNGNPLYTWDAIKSRYVSVEENSHMVVVDKTILEKGIFVQKANRSTTCTGDNYAINLKIHSR